MNSHQRRKQRRAVLRNFLSEDYETFAYRFMRTQIGGGLADLQSFQQRQLAVLNDSSIKRLVFTDRPRPLPAKDRVEQAVRLMSRHSVAFKKLSEK